MTGHRAHTVWLTGLTVALAVVALMLFITRGQVGDLASAGRQQRQRTTATICKQTNELSEKLKSLIIGGTEASKPFENVYRRLHLPPYGVRLRNARREARSLDLVDCRALGRPAKPRVRRKS